MQIDDTLVAKIASLAKLKLEDAELERTKADLTKILSMVDQLNDVDTEGIEPLIYMNDDVNVLRDDRTEQLNSKEEILRNAPDKDSDYIKVPKVLNK